MGAWGYNLIDNDEASDYLIDLSVILSVDNFHEYLLGKQIDTNIKEKFKLHIEEIRTNTLIKYDEDIFLIFIGIMKIFDLEIREDDISHFNNVLEREYKRITKIERVRYIKALDFAVNHKSSFNFNKMILINKEKK